jgi:hypothetical protein
MCTAAPSSPGPGFFSTISVIFFNEKIMFFFLVTNQYQQFSLVALRAGWP